MLKAAHSTECAAFIWQTDWMGVGPFAIERAAKLAELGYIAFVADHSKWPITSKLTSGRGRP